MQVTPEWFLFCLRDNNNFASIALYRAADITDKIVPCPVNKNEQ